MTKNQNGERYILKKEQLESLQLEAQSATPEEKAEFDEIVKESHELFLKKFKGMLDRSVETTDMASRFILTDAETNAEFQAIWGVDPTKRTHQYGSEPGVFRAYNNEGGFIIGIAQDPWNKMSDKNKAGIIQATGGEEEARKFVRKAMNQMSVLHEMTHIYQTGAEKANDVPLWLIELQAYWVGRELCDEESQVHVEEYDKRADFYQKLLDELGDDVHRLCLSKNRGHNSYIVYAIKKLFTADVQKDLFPDYEVIEPTHPNQ